jgi:hypothetical protein
MDVVAGRTPVVEEVAPPATVSKPLTASLEPVLSRSLRAGSSLPTKATIRTGSVVTIRSEI